MERITQLEIKLGREFGTGTDEERREVTELLLRLLIESLPDEEFERLLWRL